MPTPDVDALVADLRALVAAESWSTDTAGVQACASVLAAIIERELGSAPEVEGDATVWWASPAVGDQPPILLLGHLDTVWPPGTIERLPFAVADGRVTGPGVFDMKAGLVVAVHALAALRREARLPAVHLLVTSDEEIGSPGSRARIEDEARACGRVLVFEPAGDGGAFKVGRKGVALGTVSVRGRASHAGLAPAEGVNAAVGLGPLLPRIEGFGDPDTGTTVTPTLLTAGVTVNTVPDLARLTFDMRFLDDREVERVRTALAGLAPANGARLEAEMVVNRPAMPPSAAEPLLPGLREAADACGQPVATQTVGGASDGNFAAAVGASVLDGLGPDGGGAHADHEHIVVPSLVERVALVRELLPRVAAVPWSGQR